MFPKTLLRPVRPEEGIKGTCFKAIFREKICTEGMEFVKKLHHERVSLKGFNLSVCLYISKMPEGMFVIFNCIKDTNAHFFIRLYNCEGLVG